MAGLSQGLHLHLRCGQQAVPHPQADSGRPGARHRLNPPPPFSQTGGSDAEGRLRPPVQRVHPGADAPRRLSLRQQSQQHPAPCARRSEDPRNTSHSVRRVGTSGRHRQQTPAVVWDHPRPGASVRPLPLASGVLPAEVLQAPERGVGHGQDCAGCEDGGSD